MKNHFENYHPVCILTYFLTLITMTVVFNNPAVTVTGLFCALILMAVFSGIRQAAKQSAASVVMILIFTLVTALLNHRGDTPVLYINDRPVTLESLMYGMHSGILISSMIQWFGIWYDTLGSDKFIYLFGRRFPQSSLLIRMITGFIPYFKKKLREISMVQKTLGVSSSEGTLMQRIKNSSSVLSALISVTLEDTMETADSMTARGYSLKNKSSRGFYILRTEDIILFCITVIFILFFILMHMKHICDFSFYPVISRPLISYRQISLYCLTAVFYNIPIAICLLEDIRWRSLQSKI